MFDSVIRSVVAEEYTTVFIIVQADLGHLFALTNSAVHYVIWRDFFVQIELGVEIANLGGE